MNYIQKLAKSLQEKEQNKNIQLFCQECLIVFSEGNKVSSICINLNCISCLCRNCEKKHALDKNHLIQDISTTSLNLNILFKDAVYLEDQKILDRINRIFPLFSSLEILSITLPVNLQNTNFLFTVVSFMQRGLNRLQKFRLKALNGSIFSAEMLNCLGKIFHIQSLKEIKMDLKNSLSLNPIDQTNSINHFFQLVQSSHQQNLKYLQLNIQDASCNLLKILNSFTSLSNLHILKFESKSNVEIKSELEVYLMIKHLQQLKLLVEVVLEIKSIKYFMDNTNSINSLVQSLNQTQNRIRKFTLKDSIHSLGNFLFLNCNYLSKCDKKEGVSLKLAYLKKRTLIQQLYLIQKLKFFQRKEKTLELMFNFFDGQ